MPVAIAVSPSRIDVDSSLQPRAGGLDPQHVSRLQETPESWPPIVVVERGDKYLLVDGFHRFAATQNLGLDSIEVTVIDPPADGDLAAVAFALNAVHGRPLSLEDRRQEAARLLQLHPDFADREIGRRCGLAQPTVANVRQRLEHAARIEQVDVRRGADGNYYPASANQRQRQPGQLPEAGTLESAGDALTRIFTRGDRIQQRKMALYLKRLSEALLDLDDLEGWETAQDAAESCRLVLGEKAAAELAQDLGWTARVVLDVAIELGYDDSEDAE